ncbi:GtrA family protein [Paenisporosarcina sp. NPDC076898]|uniref:GtrA family protein n=1 Tax=unclassified Paenisporosarcina TaxID=2642018 RepID=UPI003D075BFF
MDTTCVLIAAYKPDDSCRQTIIELVEAGFSNILVVNDGSGKKFTPFFDKINQIQEVTVVHHAANQGKGRAIKTAFHYILNEQPTIQKVITVDADGQHLTKDICAVLQTSKEHDGIILGVRNFDKEDIPFRSRFGNKLTRNLFRYATGIGITDTQTGLRLFARKHLEWLLSIKGEAFDYELNMLAETKDAGIAIHEVEIDTVYLNGNESSHFQPIRSSLQIYKVFLKFALSGLASFGLDMGLFALFIWLWKDDTPQMYIILATIIARVISASFNYSINRKQVFEKGDEKSFVKYMILAALIMALSAGMVHGLYFLTGKGEMIIKGIVDSVLFLVGFVIQREWVFKKKKPKHV